MTNDKQRERLVELLEQAREKSRECFRGAIKKSLAEKKSFNSKTDVRSYIDVEADYLLANGVIVPPCKVGNKVYSLIETTCENTDGVYTVCEFYDEGMCACKTKCPYIYRIVECLVDNGNLLIFTAKWGKTVFLTKEEAEKALKGGV